jgi:hypothetical protein
MQIPCYLTAHSTPPPPKRNQRPTHITRTRAHLLQQQPHAVRVTLPAGHSLRRHSVLFVCMSLSRRDIRYTHAHSLWSLQFLSVLRHVVSNSLAACSTKYQHPKLHGTHIQTLVRVSKHRGAVIQTRECECSCCIILAFQNATEGHESHSMNRKSQVDTKTETDIISGL